MSSTRRALLMDGQALQHQLLAETAERSARYRDRSGRRPRLAAVLVGDDPSSLTYVSMKRRRSKKVGIDPQLVELSPTASTHDVVVAVRGLSNDPGVDGILVQHPVPSQVDERAVFAAIAPAKDVDGVTITSFAAMAFGLGGFVSCTPGGLGAARENPPKRNRTCVRSCP